MKNITWEAMSHMHLILSCCVQVGDSMSGFCRKGAFTRTVLTLQSGSGADFMYILALGQRWV